MQKDSIPDSFLAGQGYALFEYLGGGTFHAIGKSSEWCEKLWGTGGRHGKSICLAEASPFLENFLVDAESFWNSDRPGSADSGVWIERGSGGSETPLEATALRLEGKPVLVIRNLAGTYADRQRVFQTARDSLLEHERLIKETQKKEILLHCIVHDLSQPLTAMRGCFNILSLENLSADVKRMVETGQRESHRQEQMIRGILEAFSSDLAGQQSKTPEEIGGSSLGASAQRVVQEFFPAFQDKGIRLSLDPALDLSRDSNVVGDASRIERIFGNLLENALRYSPKDSTVTVGIEEHGPFLLAFVDDEGPGLPPGAVPDRLFALFSKGKDRPGKAGLGLYFCKITVERWGGTIGAETRKTGGSRFWFRLPRAAKILQERKPALPAAEEPRVKAEEKSPAAVARLRAEKPPRRLRVLLAEDTDVNRELVIELLRKRGHTVEAVENGREALAAVTKDRFDVVLMDEQMPEMDGLEATRAIRAQEASTGKHQIIIGLTGNVAPEDNERRLEAGMDGFLAKPFDMHALFEVVESPPRGVDRATASPSAPAPAAPQPAESVAEHLWRTTAGNQKLIQSLVKSFLADAPKKFSGVRHAISEKNAEKLAGAAHALKGAMAIFGAQKAVAAARNLEAMGRAGNLQRADAEFRALEDALRHLTRDLLALRSESNRAAKLPSKPRPRPARARRKR